MADQATREKRPARPRLIGRYALFGEIAAGGMATVHFGRLVGPVGFSRTVAIKRLHPQFAKDPEFVSMFLDEARLASRIQHPNVVTTLDVVAMPNEVFLVMEYVQGESLSRLTKNSNKAGERIPWGHVASIMAGMLHGLHAAHEAKSERREPLNIVHRDVSPQNVLVGTDGVSRVLDFGVAKAAMRVGSTRDNQMKGKLSYMSPEQLNGKAVDRRTDIFAAAVVLWETLVGKRLFEGADAGEIFAKVLASEIPDPRSVISTVPSSLNDVVMKGLSRNPDSRFQTAREFAIALEGSVPLSTTRAVGEWVERSAHSELDRRAHMIADIEAISMTAQDLARFERESEAPPSGRIGEPSSISEVKQASGSRPRVQRPSSARSDDVATAVEEGSAKSASTSAVSSLAVPRSISKPAPAKGSGGGVYIGAIAACVAGGALAFLVFSRVGSKPTGSAASTSELAAPAATTGAPSSRSVAPTETVSVEDLPMAPPDAGDFQAGSPAHRRSGRRIPKGVAPKAKEPAQSLPNCNPPYIIDGAGIKRPKPGCL
jgi:serine/threonine-protein kinase